jgi:hypothetical protein
MKKTNLENLQQVLNKAKRKEDSDLRKWSRGELSRGLRAVEKYYKKISCTYFVQDIENWKLSFSFKASVTFDGKLTLSLLVFCKKLCVYKTHRVRTYTRTTTCQYEAVCRVRDTLASELDALGLDCMLAARYDQRTKTSVYEVNVSV